MLGVEMTKALQGEGPQYTKSSHDRDPQHMKPAHDGIPQYIREIDAYIPGKPVEEVERELGIRAIKLASNENPLGPSPMGVEAAKRAMGEANRYPAEVTICERHWRSV
jgi:hypothetical protein